MPGSTEKELFTYCYAQQIQTGAGSECCWSTGLLGWGQVAVSLGEASGGQLQGLLRASRGNWLFPLGIEVLPHICPLLGYF
jgi:hypothetical protein